MSGKQLWPAWKEFSVAQDSEMVISYLLPITPFKSNTLVLLITLYQK